MEFIEENDFGVSLCVATKATKLQPKWNSQRAQKLQPLNDWCSENGIEFISTLTKMDPEEADDGDSIRNNTQNIQPLTLTFVDLPSWLVQNRKRRVCGKVWVRPSERSVGYAHVAEYDSQKGTTDSTTPT
jgi:hypothetical protein